MTPLWISGRTGRPMRRFARQPSQSGLAEATLHRAAPFRPWAIEGLGAASLYTQPPQAPQCLKRPNDQKTPDGGQRLPKESNCPQAKRGHNQPSGPQTTPDGISRS